MFESTLFYLRELRRSDLEGNWYKWFNDLENTRFQNKGILPNTKEMQENYYENLIKSQQDVVFAIIAKEEDKHIGNAGLHNINWIHKSAELGIVLGERSFHGLGIGKIAWNIISNYAFDFLNLNRVYATILDGNENSRKCAEASGFRCDGVIREAFYKQGKYLNAYYFNVLKKEFIKL